MNEESQSRPAGPPPSGGSAVMPPPAKPVAQGPMMHSPEIDKIALALAKAQGAMSPAEKNAINPHFNKSYADLADCWDAARAPLAANELAIIQLTGNSGNMISLTTMLIHSSGQWFRSTLALRPVKDDPQGAGSAITYMRRYGFNAMVGIAQEEGDDDGNAASGKPAGNPQTGGTGAIPPKKPSGTKPQPKPSSPLQTQSQGSRRGATASASRGAPEPSSASGAEDDVPDFDSGTPAGDDSAAGGPMSRADMMKELTGLWGPYLKKMKVKPLDVLVERYQVEEVRNLTDEQVADLLDHMTQVTR